MESCKYDVTDITGNTSNGSHKIVDTPCIAIMRIYTIYWAKIEKRRAVFPPKMHASVLTLIQRISMLTRTNSGFRCALGSPFYNSDHRNDSDQPRKSFRKDSRSQ